MNIKDLFSFAKKSEAVTPEGPTTVPRNLMSAQAVTQLVETLTRIPEVDEILQNAGITRASLSRLETDDEIFAALRTRRESVLATPWRIENTDDATRDLITEILGPHIESIVNGAWKAVPYGYSVMERVYKKRADGKIGFDSVLVKPMEWFEPQRDGKLKFFAESGVDAEGVLVDLNYKFLLTRQEATYKNPKGEALMSRLYWPWLFRHNSWQFWAQFLEKYGSPILVGKSTDTKKMATALASAVQDAAIAVGKDDEVQALEPKNNGEAFQIAEGVLVKRYQKLILGQTLTSDSGNTDGKGNGSFALGKVHAKVAETLKLADLRLLRPTLQNVVTALCALNKWDLKATFVFADEDDLAASRASRDEILYRQGIRFKKSYYIDTYRLEEKDFDITDPVEQAAKLAEAKADDKTEDGKSRSGKSKDDKEREKEDKKLAASFAFSQRKFTEHQQLIEDEVEELLASVEQPISDDIILAVVKASKDATDLETRLGKLLEQVKTKQFNQLLEQGLFYADVVGYAAAQERPEEE